MGARNSKILPLPIPVTIKRIGECLIPDDRNQLLDLFEMIDINMCEEKDLEINTKQLQESNGMMVMMRVAKRMIQDVDIVFVTVQLVETIKFNTPIVMDFIQFGGLDILDKAYRVHKDDELLSGSIPNLRKILIAIGSPASIVEINKEALNLQFCRHCQEIVEYQRQKHSDHKGPVVIPKSSDRINRVLKFMDNFLVSKDVQIAALDAVISFARNADAPRSTHETNLIAVLILSLKQHTKEPNIVWRVAMAYSLVSAFSGDLAFDVAKTGAHTILIENYALYKKQGNHLVQQQILWFFGSLLMWPPSKKVVNKQQECMDFFKTILQDFEDLKAKMAADPASKKKGYKDDKLFVLCIPLSIRSFVRETNGELARKTERKAEKKAAFKERRNFDERPKFGTVQSTIYTQGETGLIAKGNEEEDEYGNEKRKIPDWERKLNNMS